MKNLITYAIVFSLISLASIKIYSQEIKIDSTFNSSFDLFPFEQIENISGINVEGDVHLNSDTSLVRVILKDDNGFQYMIFETYPLICPNLYINFNDSCDETCYLEQLNPYSIIIQVIDATLNLKSFYYSADPKENASEERYQAKRSADAEKIEMMNQLIPSYNMSWMAGDNEIVASYYEQKRNMFGDGYNLRGYEYYSEGVFEFLGHSTYPKVDPEMVWEFDWRNHHGVNDSLSPYWNGDLDKAGWLTGAKKQGPVCANSCWAFAAIGVTEAIANLYSARHINYNLSEQDLLSCSHAGDCCNGGHVDSALRYIKNYGVVTENCFSYHDSDYYTIPCTSNLKCQNPNPIIKIFDTLYFNTANEKNFDSIRRELITKGPLSISFPTSGPLAHAVVLSGFKFNIEDSTLTWIIKDSHGNTGLEKGFREIQLDYLMDAIAVIPPIFRNDTSLEVECHDYDHDHYCFWGIGLKPASCNTCDCFEEEDCDDNDSLVGGYDENYNCRCIFEIDPISHHITADTSWVDSTYVNYDVIIDSGACLTISSYAAFAPNAGILVSQGAELIIDGGLLTKACPDLWDGIEVWGSDTVQYFERFFGKVVLTDSAIIEFAKTGIANYCTRCAYSQMQSGGIILADNSTFRNNETDVVLGSFRNLWQGHEIPYRASFQKCQFITNEDIYPISDPKTHVDMKNVYGVAFDGCVFSNDLGLLAIPYTKRGKGITSIDASFLLLPHCNDSNAVNCVDITPCEFRGMEYGIKALNCISVRSLEIQDVKFKDNFLGLSLSGIDYASILSNDFKCPLQIIGEAENRFKGGLFLEGCSGYHIEGNNFHSAYVGQSGVSPAYGIGIKNSGPDYNEIYNNTFEKLEIGIICNGENRGGKTGLCLKCNDMTDNINDFVVANVDNPPSVVHQGINYYQGDPRDSLSYYAPAGNTFSSFDSIANINEFKYYNYSNTAEEFWYIHHAENLNYLLFPTYGNYTDDKIELKEWHTLVYEKDSACPSGLGGGGGLKSYTDPRLTMLEADNQTGLLSEQLNLLIDGGNTEELNFEVMTSFPDEGLGIRQELLNESPYLSDTVLKQAIYKEDVLPNAMIRDVLEANPQSAKSDEVLNTLDSRFNPMPDYMMAQIMEGKKYLGAKELLEAEIQSWSQIRAQAKADLFRQFLLDSTIVNPVDSVIALLETENDLNSKYNIALSYWEKADSANAMFILNNIPFQFTLTENQYNVYQHYFSYYGILKMMEDSCWRASDLDSANVEVLFNLMEDGNADISALSRGLLVKGGFYNYIETVNISDFSKSSKPHYFSNEKPWKEPEEDLLRLFPNPAGDYVIAYYDLEAKYSIGQITISNMKGEILRRYDVSPGENQIVVDLKYFINGLYIITLEASNRKLECEKLSKGGD
jgi:hypothetical protein